jgi:hypothetical protein
MSIATLQVIRPSITTKLSVPAPSQFLRKEDRPRKIQQSRILKGQRADPRRSQLENFYSSASWETFNL